MTNEERLIAELAAAIEHVVPNHIPATRPDVLWKAIREAFPSVRPAAREDLKEGLKKELDAIEARIAHLNELQSSEALDELLPFSLRSPRDEF